MAALAIPMRDIQDYARQVRIGAYELKQPWDVFHIVINHRMKTAWIVSVRIQPHGSMVVISRDTQRLHGLRYRIRTNRAHVTNIAVVTGKNRCERVKECVTDERVCIRTNNVLDYTKTFDANPLHLEGVGIYVSPTYGETLKLLNCRIHREILQPTTNTESDAASAADAAERRIPMVEVPQGGCVVIIPEPCMPSQTVADDDDEYGDLVRVIDMEKEALRTAAGGGVSSAPVRATDWQLKPHQTAFSMEHDAQPSQS
jgi:hypothetical protein